MLRQFFGPRSGSVPVGDYTVSGPYPSSYSPTDLLKTQLHCHTSQSFDGSVLPNDMVANYVSAGYDALALTDHDKVTSQPAGMDYAIPSNELTPSGHHIISLNCTYLRGSTTDSQTMIDGVLAAGGQAHLAHPRWSSGFSEATMLALSGHFGFEVHNGHCVNGAGQNPVTYPGYAIPRWDALLAAGGRVGVWGVAVDDLHAVGAFDTYDMGCVKVFVESASVANIITALVAGNFVADVSNFGITPGYPVRGSSDVTLTCTNATRIEAWGRTGLLDSADADNLTVPYPFDGSSGYMRFVAVGDYTEPWDSISDRWAAYVKSWAVAGGVLSVSSDETFGRLILRRHRQGDFSAQTDIQLNGTTGGAALMFNVLNSTHYYMVRIGESSNGSYNNKLTIAKTSNGSFGNPLASYSFTANSATWYTVKMDYVASTGRTRAKVWATGDSEPDWQISTTDTSWTWGGFGYRANRTCSYDNLYIDGFQTFYQPVFIDPA